jgi:hypothetical protein
LPVRTAQLSIFHSLSKLKEHYSLSQNLGWLPLFNSHDRLLSSGFQNLRIHL